MENQEITVKDLQIGDEVLIGSSAGIKYVKILRPLKMAKKPNWKGEQVYSSVLCSFNEQITTYTLPGRSYIYTNKKSLLTPNGHNKQVYVDFNYKNIWLIKREENGTNIS